MSTASNHLGETIQDLLGGQLGEVERAQAQAHLQACARCRREFQSLRQVQKAVAAHAARQAVPADLGIAITRALDQEDVRAPVNDSRRRAVVRPKPRSARWVLGFGLAATAAFASILLWSAWTPARLPAAVAEGFAKFQAGEVTLEMRTAEALELERFFAAREVGFEAHVLDLGMMTYRVVGGRVERVQGRSSTLTYYQGSGGARVLCQMYVGTLDELPPATEVLEHNGIAFRVYRQDGLTAVFWREGKVICVLVSDLDPREVIRLAFAKAVRVPV